LRSYAGKQSPRLRRRRLVLAVLTPFIAAIVTIFGTTPAAADTVLCSGQAFCTGAGYIDHGYYAHSGTQYWNQYSGDNCTNYAAYVEQTVNGVAKPSWLGPGNADSWWDYATGHVTKSSTPVVGAVAWWGDAAWNGNSGHVAYVEEVLNGGNTVKVSWANSFQWRLLNIGDPMWPQGFIYVTNLGSGGGNSVGTRLMADVNGDHKADAVVMYRDSGSAFVGLSTGTSFGNPGQWSFGHSVNASRYFLADVNGDSLADLVAFFAANGNWSVSLSSGSGFWSPTQWAAGQAVGTSKQFLADVNGDGMADLVTFDANTGDWYVSTSSGSGFWPPVRWIQGHGYGSNRQVVGDFNGDGKADAAVYAAASGNWYVGLSTGSVFNYPGQWSAGHGMNSTNQVAADISGDHRADIAYYYTTGTWEAGTSSGAGFWQPTDWAYGQGGGSTDQFLADVNGDGMADEVTFFGSGGDWYVDTSSGSGFWGPPQLWVHGLGAGS
jgi:hypothetical protein